MSLSLLRGSLVRWNYVDEDYLGVILEDLGIKTFTRKYLIYWFESGNILECFETDIEKIC